MQKIPMFIQPVEMEFRHIMPEPIYKPKKRKIKQKKQNIKFKKR